MAAVMASWWLQQMSMAILRASRRPCYRVNLDGTGRLYVLAGEVLVGIISLVVEHLGNGGDNGLYR